MILSVSWLLRKGLHSIYRIIYNTPESVIMKAGLWFAGCSAIYRACHCAWLSVPRAGCLVAERGWAPAAWESRLLLLFPRQPSLLALLSFERSFSFPLELSTPQFTSPDGCCFCILLVPLFEVYTAQYFAVALIFLSWWICYLLDTLYCWFFLVVER